jgi:hypothetical protein
MSIRLGDSAMKTLSIITVALILGLGGAAMANDSGANHQDDTNSTGPNPYMSAPYPTTSGGKAAFAMHPVRHHVVKHHVEK